MQNVLLIPLWDYGNAYSCMKCIIYKPFFSCVLRGKINKYIVNIIFRKLSINIEILIRKKFIFDKKGGDVVQCNLYNFSDDA